MMVFDVKDGYVILFDIFEINYKGLDAYLLEFDWG